jgi:tetratricopeptide (TPR) repeat protein
MDESYKDLVKRGEMVREKGDPKGAIPIFQQAIELTEIPSEKSNATRHLGLCYEHLGSLEEAEKYYVQAIELSRSGDDEAGTARANRHLASVELKRRNYQKALVLARLAHSQMYNMVVIPSDLVWVTHGIVKVLIEGKYPKEDVRKWARIEWQDLKRMLPIEKNPIARRVWTTGWMMDASYAWAPWTWPLLPLAFAIATFSGLGLRMRQMLTGKR